MSSESRRLRRPITIGHHRVRTRGHHLRHRRRRSRLTTGDHLTQRRETRRILRREQVEQRRRHKRRRHPVLPGHPPELLRRNPPRRRHHHRTTPQQRSPDLIGRRIEGMRGMEQHPLITTTTPTTIQSQSDHVPMRDRHTLGHPRRTRREHHIREGRRRESGGKSVHGRFGQGLLVQVDHPDVRAQPLRHPPTRNRVRQHETRTRLPHQPRHTLRRIIHVHRHINTTRTQHTQHPRHHMRTTLQHQHDRTLRTQPPTTQHRSHTRTQRVQLRIRNLTETTHHGRRTRHPRHPLREHLHNRNRPRSPVDVLGVPAFLRGHHVTTPGFRFDCAVENIGATVRRSLTEWIARICARHRAARFDQNRYSPIPLGRARDTVISSFRRSGPTQSRTHRIPRRNRSNPDTNKMKNTLDFLGNPEVSMRGRVRPPAGQHRTTQNRPHTLKEKGALRPLSMMFPASRVT